MINRAAHATARDPQTPSKRGQHTGGLWEEGWVSRLGQGRQTRELTSTHSPAHNADLGCSLQKYGSAEGSKILMLSMVRNKTESTHTVLLM